MNGYYDVLFLFHTYTFCPLELNTYQFDFKLHYQAYIIFMSFSLVYLFIYFLNSHCIPICLTSALGLQYVSINLSYKFVL